MTQTPSGPAASGSRKDPVQLLVSAVGALPQADQEAIYAWLLRRLPDLEPGASGGLTASRGPRAVSLAALLRPDMTVTVSQQFPQSSGQQMVPVRFSSEQHARLREWCTEHGFSMATVVRGLVARFLESQPPEAGQQA
jgi:ParG